MLKPVVWLLFRLEYHGVQEVPREGGLVICCNHRSVIDAFLLALPLSRPVHYMAKSELFTDHGPVVRWLLKKMGAILVRRGKSNVESIRTTMGILAAGGVVGVFPEGHCFVDGGVFRPKAGVALIALKAKAPIQPVGISCEGHLLHFRRHIVIRFGEVIPYALLAAGEKGEGEDMRAAAQLVACRVNALMGEVG